MRSDKLGYEAPIEVYDGKFYRYADDDYSITDSPLSDDTCRLVMKAINLIRQKGHPSDDELSDILEKVGHRLNAILLHQ